MSFSLKKLLESVFPFLFSALQKSWDNLTKPQQDAMVNSGLIGQYLKNNLKVLGTDLVGLITANTALTSDETTNTLIALAKTFGLTTTSINDAVAFLQSKLTNASSSAEWNGFLTIILNAGATILSGGTLDWVHIALGLGEWAYQQFVQPKEIETLNIASVDVTNASAPIQVEAPVPVAPTADVPLVNPPATSEEQVDPNV